VKSSAAALQGSDARQNRERQELMNGLKRLEELIVEHQKQKREAQAIADVRNAVGRLGEQLQAVAEENRR
jgi:hypothetical protein